MSLKRGLNCWRGGGRELDASWVAIHPDVYIVCRHTNVSALSTSELNSISERASLLISEYLAGRAWRRGAQSIQRALHADMEHAAHMDSSAGFSDQHRALIDQFVEPSAPSARYERAVAQDEIREIVRRALKPKLAAVK